MAKRGPKLARISTTRPYKHGKLPSQKALLERNFKEILAEKMSVHFPDVVDSMIAVAKGWTQVVVDKDGSIREVKEKPDVQAGKLLFEHTVAKPKQEVELSGKVGIVNIVQDLENELYDDSGTQA